MLTLNTTILDMDVTQPGPYALVEQYLNVTLFLDYYVLNWAIANIDWGYHNFYLGYNEKRGEGLAYVPWDSDGSFEYKNWQYPAYTGTWGYINDQYWSTSYNTDADMPRYYYVTGREIVGQLMWRSGSLLFELAFTQIHRVWARTTTP